MSSKRIKRLNSLLREVISEVIRKEIQNPAVSPLTTITEVDISKDLHYAVVSVSVIGDSDTRNATVKALQKAAGYIGMLAAKQIVLRYFPSLTFTLDTSVDRQMRIDSLLKKIEAEKEEEQKKA